MSRMCVDIDTMSRMCVDIDTVTALPDKNLYVTLSVGCSSISLADFYNHTQNTYETYCTATCVNLLSLYSPDNCKLHFFFACLATT